MKIKNGMAGSRCGKGRRNRTEELKARSKKLRRREGKKSAEQTGN